MRTNWGTPVCHLPGVHHCICVSPDERGLARNDERELSLSPQQCTYKHFQMLRSGPISTYISAQSTERRPGPLLSQHQRMHSFCLGSGFHNCILSCTAAAQTRPVAALPPPRSPPLATRSTFAHTSAPRPCTHADPALPCAPALLSPAAAPSSSKGTSCTSRSSLNCSLMAPCTPLPMAGGPLYLRGHGSVAAGRQAGTRLPVITSGLLFLPVDVRHRVLGNQQGASCQLI